jgi:hypothetical protein
LTNRDHFQGKNGKEKTRKRKEIHFQSQILPTYHSSIHEGLKKLLTNVLTDK